jgi:sterol desaturase/sphingolipid hydroxylase (fatty acid hydroxylase superfamily)
LARLGGLGQGLLAGGVTGDLIAIVVLDFSFYVSHVAMHRVPWLWRIHRVHHSDAFVDVTTTIRQHPLEGVIRYAVLAAVACALGVSIHAFAVYRLVSAMGGLLEHANIRVPRWVDRILASFTTWPNMHKVHHSRFAGETDTNYGNILSLFDRAFSTYTPSSRGETVVCGLDGFDDASVQTTAGLLRMPFETTAAARR